MHASRIACVIGTLLLASPAAAQNSSDTKNSGNCGDAYVRAQKLRAAGQLLETKEALTQCLADACPEYQRVDCSQWMSEVTSDLPTVVFRVVDATGRERTDVRVNVDGAQLADQLDGLPIAVDPGPHTFTLSWPGSPPVKRTVTLVTGEKNRKIEIVLDAATPDPTPPPPRPEPPEQRIGPGIHPAAWVLGAVGVVGFGLFAGFGVHSISLEGCAPVCSDAEVDEIETMRIVADASAGAGAAFLAAGLIVAILTYDDGEPASGLLWRF